RSPSRKEGVRRRDHTAGGSTTNSAVSSATAISSHAPTGNNVPLGHAADDAAICRAIIALGYNLGLGILAEGVSSQVQLEFLRAEVCDAVQGFLMSQAVPANEFA